MEPDPELNRYRYSFYKYFILYYARALFFFFLNIQDYSSNNKVWSPTALLYMCNQMLQNMAIFFEIITYIHSCQFMTHQKIILISGEDPPPFFLGGGGAYIYKMFGLRSVQLEPF